ncbi:MAG TPA: hypothetical protein VIP06_03555 [Nocardioides sp.]
MKKIIALIAATLTAALLLSGCGGNSTYEQRKDQQNSVTLKDSLEIANLKEKLGRENDPTAVRYVYLMNFGQIVGYYVIKGKVSSSGSQLAPEEEFIRPCSGCDGFTTDSAQDDGTYGTGDPGIFFFLADGAMVSTSLDYVESDAPMPIDVPRLGGNG